MTYVAMWSANSFWSREIGRRRTSHLRRNNYCSRRNSTKLLWSPPPNKSVLTNSRLWLSISIKQYPLSQARNNPSNGALASTLNIISLPIFIAYPHSQFALESCKTSPMAAYCPWIETILFEFILTHLTAGVAYLDDEPTKADDFIFISSFK